MTTTTKIFVILVSLFALIFTPLAIQFAARTHDWRQAAENFRDQAETAYANERSAYAVAAAEVEYYRDLLKTERGNLANAQQRISDMERQGDQLKQERTELGSSRDNWEASARLLTSQLAVASDRNKILTDAQDSLLRREQELRSQNNQLVDRVKELSAQVAILDQQHKQKVEELAAFREENQKLRNQLKLGQAGQVMVPTATPAARAETPVATSPIVGQVTEVNGTLATINVGAASGVHEGMTMIVTRNGDYICDLEITSNVTPNEAVARIRFEDSGRRVRVQDRIMDEASFASR